MANVTQLQIAKALNLSRSTVATVFSQAPGRRISKEVTTRVLEMANRMGYRPNRYAQVMRNGRSGYIGILGFNSLRELSQRKIVAAKTELQKHGYDWIVQERHNEGEDLYKATEGLIERLIDARVEGILLVYPDHHITPAMLQKILDEGIPVVGIASDHLQPIPNFISDRHWGYARMVKHLLGGGYRRITLLGLSEGSGPAAFEEAMATCPEAEGEICFICRATCPTEGMSHEYIDYLCGKYGVKKILAGKKPLPEALVCNNDAWALGALTALYEGGLKVPEDIAITGFDNDLSAAFGAVPLTTMRHPIEEISKQAIDCLMEMVASGKTLDSHTVAVRGELIVRRSCGLGTFTRKKKTTR